MTSGTTTSRAAARAVLIGVDAFDHPSEFEPIGNDRAVRGIETLRDVLTSPHAGGLFASQVQLVANPASPEAVMEAVRHEQQHAGELLLCYYVGHGCIPPRSDELYLAVRGSRRSDIESSGVHLRALVSALANSAAERVVLVLDCCRSGGTPGVTLPGDRAFSVITSSPRKMLISAGLPGDRMTPFTTRVVEVLRDGVSPHQDVTVDSLCDRLHELAAEDEPRYGQFPWAVGRHSSGGGGSTVLSRARHPVPPPPLPPLGERLRRAYHRLRARLAEGRRWLAGPAWPNRVIGIGTALAVLVVAATVVGSRLSQHSSCPLPLELRMVTAPEEVEPMTRLAEHFEESGANLRGADGAHDCRSTRITVYGAGLDALAKAFSRARDWGSGRSGDLARVGPQPDLWAAQSTAEVSYVRGGLSEPERLRPLAGNGSDLMASDQPVLVLTSDAAARLGLPPAARTHNLSWATLRAAFHRPQAAGMRLLRPNPTVSGVGLVHTLGMHSKDYNADSPFDAGVRPLPGNDIAWLETHVIGLGRSVADGLQALCELRTSRGGDRAGGRPVGALVTKRQSELLKDGAPLGDGCPETSHALTGDATQTYTLLGVPWLDYPLVEVRWPATDRADRDAAVQRFRDWLGSTDGLNQLGGYEGPTQTAFDLAPNTLDTWLDRFRAAHPDLRLAVLFDVSGSMRELKRFPTAQEAVEEALGRLGEGDRYTLTAFPAHTDGTGSTALVPRARRYDPGHGLPGLAARVHPVGRRYTDLLAALKHAAAAVPDRDDGFQHAVLLVTDGEYRPGRTPRVGEIAALGRQLRARGTPVIVASMRPYGCASGHEASALAAASGGECAPLSGDLPAQLARSVAALTEGRRL